MKERKHKISIKKLIVLSNCVIMASFFGINSYFNQRCYKKALEQEIETQQKQQLLFVNGELEHAMEAVEHQARAVVNNYGVIKCILNYQKNASSYEQLVFQNNMSQNLSAVAYSLKDVVSVNILMEDGRLRTRKINGIYNYDAYADREQVKKIREMSSGWLWNTKNSLDNFPYVDHTVTYVLHFYSGVYYGDALGHLVINLDENLFYALMQPYNQEGAEMLMYDAAGNIISSTDRTILGKNIAKTDYAGYIPQANESTAAKSRKRDRIVSTCQSHDKEYTLIAVLDFDRITQDVRQMQKFLFRIFLIIFFVFMGFSAFLACKISKPILKLAKEVTGLDEADWTKRLEGKSSIYEIAVLSTEFNNKMEMIENLAALTMMQEKAKRRSDMEVLQSQINPHFLYNTLETINWMVLRIKQKEISRMVVNLGTFLRLSLNKGKSVYLVGDELDHLKCYLEIHNIRCGGKIAFSLETEEGVRELRMTKLLLQPLVENSIMHGFDFRGGAGQLKLKVSRKEGYLNFRLEDDGCGMTEEQIRDIYDAESETGVGLKNVMKRIQFYYGRDCGLTIDSRPGEGTAIEMKIREDVPNFLLYT